jgi:hypothetical protein
MLDRQDKIEHDVPFIDFDFESLADLTKSAHSDTAPSTQTALGWLSSPTLVLVTGSLFECKGTEW